MKNFNGEEFTGGILAIILTSLLLFGSTKIKDLTSAPL